MRNREHLAAGLLLVGRHPLPELLRVDGVVRRQRNDLVGLVLAVAEDHVPVEIVAVRGAGPLVTDESSEAAGLVVFLGGRGRPRPHRPREPRQVLQRIGAGQRPLHPRVVRLGPLALLDVVVDHLAPRALEELGVGFGDRRRKPEVLGVVGDDEEIERPAEPRRKAGVRRHRLAAREAVGFVGAQPGAEHPGVRRERRVQVRVAEINPVRKGLGRVGRILGPVHHGNRWRVGLRDRKTDDPQGDTADGYGQDGSDGHASLPESIASTYCPLSRQRGFASSARQSGTAAPGLAAFCACTSGTSCCTTTASAAAAALGYCTLVHVPEA